MKWLNFVFRLFGYEWVKDETPYERQRDDPITDEGWDDLYEHSPRYKLRKIRQGVR
ncbi:hypothetical protein [Thiomicrorhabdus sp.]|uniref:hypothetical protein n=1 Tax=Thiomicrorhabdus sp. TaxID=2039724 RepID=UPI0029C6AB24|nr:hypothetical protein [Thiomicrorhabdus sp.]